MARKRKVVTKTIELDEQEWEGPYESTIYWEGSVILDQRILDAVDEDWRKTFYNLDTEERIATHIVRNFVVNGVYAIHQLDGWANMPNDVVVEIKAR